MDQIVLIVDDDMQLTSFLSRFLKKHGFNVQTASSGAQARALFDANHIGLVVLDLILPDADGFDIAKEIRAEAQTPIIMLTARDEVFDRIVGLELGADDYLTKPYEPRELLARIKAVLRRTDPIIHGRLETKSQNIVFAGLHFDFEKRTLHRASNNQAIVLTGAEFTLLAALINSAPEPITRDRLMSKLYGSSLANSDRAVDAHISRLRRKIDDVEADASLIRAVRGRGYVLATKIEALA